jgi:hypothetical protein
MQSAHGCHTVDLSPSYALNTAIGTIDKPMCAVERSYMAKIFLWTRDGCWHADSSYSIAGFVVRRCTSAFASHHRSRELAHRHAVMSATRRIGWISRLARGHWTWTAKQFRARIAHADGLV